MLDGRAHSGTMILDLGNIVDRVVKPTTRYQLQDSDGKTFGPVCPMFSDQAESMNRALAEDGIDFRWCQL